MARTPVLFIPGLCGSFNLTVLLDWRGPTLSGWGFPPFINYGKNFTEAFQKAGYTRDRDLFVAFYDWRKSVQDAATTYLKPWIDRAKQRSGARKVILVGHSMGGLVCRSYIQSKSYAGDVERLITLGTPHRGSGEAYYAWGGGEPKSDPNVKVVFDVYLWYLRHAHPFQTDLSKLKAMRTLMPGVRDLLPIDNYLLNQGGPPIPKPEDTMVERNLVGDILNQPAALETLFGRVPVTTISSVGLATIKTITVAGPPLPPGDPPVFPDGEPVSDQTDGDGDGTVLRFSAQIEHPRAGNTPAFTGVPHGSLPDHPTVLSQIFGEIGVATPVLGAAPVPEPQLLIMTASPVTMSVETPRGAPMPPAGVLGAAFEEEARPRRPRTVRGKDHGHAGKHLNIVVIPRPAAGTYKVDLTGTATGTFALGALLTGPEGVTILGGGEEAVVPQPQVTPITTTYGRVAAGTALFYDVTCSSLETPPVVQLDTPRTTNSAIARLRGAVGQAGTLLGGGEAESDPVDTVLGGVADPTTQVDALSSVAERVVGVDDPELAQALITQLQAVKA